MGTGSRRIRGLLLGAALAALSGISAAAAPPSPPPGLEAMLSYPFESDLVASPHGDVIAWVRTVRGVRNIWVARAPDYAPRRVTDSRDDDGQELTGLTFSPDGTRLAWVRGGDHDENWPAEGNLAPDPASSPEQPMITVWSAAVAGGPPVKIGDGDTPAVSDKGVIAYVKDKGVWSAAADGRGKPERLFFDRGSDGELAWSPDGARLAFVSDRGDHGFIGVFAGKDRPLTWLAPSTGIDDSPRWSPDGASIAFTRQQGRGGAPEPLLREVPHPWSIWVARADGGEAHVAWRSPDTLDGSFPEVEGDAHLDWGAGNRLVFLAEMGNWQHLYSVPAAGGQAMLLTPGDYMVEHASMSPDHGEIIFDANTGGNAGDGERRHLFRVSTDRPGPTPITAGDVIEDYPVALSNDQTAYMATGPKAPPQIAVIGDDGRGRRELAAGPAADYPTGRMVTPRVVTFQAADGQTIHGILFADADAMRGRREPGVVFVHGGPPRQMLLGWHYMDYYTHAYAVNQYLATHGFVVLSVNYRLGIGYGRAFNHPPGSGPRGAAEYQDVVAAGRYLQTLPAVDPARIGIWGGSYGGYLTAMALARDSSLFKAGVDLHGVHDWTTTLAHELKAPEGFEKGDRDQFMAVAFKASPVADLSHWTSPVLLIQGDDDRNVQFHQTVDLARRLEARGIPYEELVLPNEIHGFLRWTSWLRADTATVAFLDRTLRVTPEVP